MSSRTTEIASEIVAVLVPFIVEYKREMTYGELSKAIKEKFGDNVPAWHGMANPLGEIQDACKDLGLPNLPVMVVDHSMSCSDITEMALEEKYVTEDGTHSLRRIEVHKVTCRDQRQ